MGILSEILSSKIRAEIFRMLFGLADEELHVREIERRSGLTIGTVQSELRKLLNLDLIVKRQDGNRVYYGANTNHPLYPDIRNLVLKTSGLVDVLRSALIGEKAIKIAFVFGSLARQEVKAGSDVDLAVIGNIGLRKLTGLLIDASDKVGREINPHIFTEKEFLKRKMENDHFLSHVLKSPRIFIIGTENELTAMD